MKKTLQTMIIALAILAAGGAMAADTATVTVTATVLPACMFSADTATLAFGPLPFAANGTALGTPPLSANLTFWCTAGTNYTITDDNGLWESGTTYQMRSVTLVSPEYIAYNFSYLPTSGTGAGPGVPQTLTVTASVGATYSANSPDDYSDTVTLTINP